MARARPLNRKSDESGKRATLRRMKVTAGLILVALVTLYLLTFFIPVDSPWLDLLRAAAAAGVVGGLADWFAVVALFRHPLGLPIPHTALLPRNQHRVARNIGTFIEEHFLIPEDIARKVEASGLAQLVANWLATPQNKALVARHVANALAKLTSYNLPESLQTALTQIARRTALAAGDSDLLAKEITTILKHGAGSDGVTAAIGFLRTVLDENREAAETLVQERSRWWINPKLDKGVARIGVKGVLSALDELADPESVLRKKFDAALIAGIDRLYADGVLKDLIAETIDRYAESADFDAASGRLIDGIRTHVAAHFKSDELTQAIEDAIGEAAEFIRSDPDTQLSIDRSLAVISSELVAATRPVIGQYVAETISGWEPDQLIERFETEAGTDLQFIRINGSVLGCVIGGALYVIERALS